MRRALSVLVSIISVPIILINLFGSVVSGIWLIVIGEWATFWLGVGYMLVGSFFISLLLLLTLLFAAPLPGFFKKKNTVGVVIFGFLSLGTTYLILLSSSFFIFNILTQSYTDTNTFPLLIWAFGVAIAPWSYMASKERDNEGTQLTLFVANMVLLLVLVLIGFFNFTLSEAFTAGTYLMFVLLLNNVITITTSMKNGGDSLIWTGGFEKSEYDDQDIQTYLFTMIWIAQLDGKLKAAEIISIRDNFKKLAGESVSKKLIKDLYVSMNSDKSSLIDIEDNLNSLNDDMKSIILRGAYMVARSDSEFHETEKTMLKELSVALGFSNDESVRILKKV